MANNFIFLETSLETVQEDEELIEAVEAAVEIAAKSVQHEIRREISQWFMQAQTTIETVLPVLVEYRKNPSRMQQDLRDWIIFLFIYGVAFLFLAPRRRCNNKKVTSGLGKMNYATENNSIYGRHNRSRSWSNYYQNDSFGSLNLDDMIDSAGSSSLNSKTGARCLREDETDEERFSRVYESLCVEKYAKLILPPVCQLIEKPIASELRQQQAAAEARLRKEEEQRLKKESHTEIADEKDDPAKRLHIYFRHFMILARSLFTFDYAGAAWTILLWLQGIRRHRRTNSQERVSSVVIHDDDDLDDESSSMNEDETRNIPANNNTNTCVEGFMSVDPGAGDSEKDKHGDHDSAANFKSTATSTTPYSTPLSSNCDSVIIGPSDIDTDAPRLPRMDSNKASGGDKRDLAPLMEENKNADFTPGNSSSYKLPPTILKNDLPIFRLRNESKQAEQDEDNSDACQYETDSVQPGEGNPTLIEPKISSSKKLNPRLQVGKNKELTFAPVSKAGLYNGYFFETANSRESLHRFSLEVPVPDKNGYVLGDEYLADDTCTPLLVFVNSRSGPQQGQLLITQLRRLLNPIQIWDLANGPPSPILESFLVITKLRILVCGGDGTVSWIISALDSLDLQQRKWPPIAILPLGTGNDLARVHGWGAGYNNESLIAILEQISESYVSLLDRWELTVQAQSSKKRVKFTKNFFNYFSLGVDAETALQVHYLRERRPEWFFSRFVNKAWYGVLSAEESIKGNSINICREISLYADGVHVPLPHDSQGIIILNIDSYAGGVPLWTYGVKKATGRSPGIRRSQSMVHQSQCTLAESMVHVDSTDDLSGMMTQEELYAKVTACDRQSSCQDGYLEIVSVRGLVHLGQCKVGIGNAHRVAQCREIKIVIKKKVALQIDGEPWRQDKCILNIKRKKDPALMLHRSSDDGGIETEMSGLLDWAEDRRLIDSQVHTILMKEFSRRIETKTRQRRQEQNVLRNLKRAIGSTSTVTSLVHQANLLQAFHKNGQHGRLENGQRSNHQVSKQKNIHKPRSISMQDLVGVNSSLANTENSDDREVVAF